MPAKPHPAVATPIPRRLGFDAGAILAALPDPVLVADAKGVIQFANAAAEQFFDTSAATLVGGRLAELLPADSPLFALMASVRQTGHSVSEYGVTLETPRLGSHVVTIQVAPIGEDVDRLVVTLKTSWNNMKTKARVKGG